MEYLGRLGLVPRKSKKDRETSPQKRRYAEESRALKTDLARATETDPTCATIEASSLTALKPDHTQLPRPVEICATSSTSSPADFPRPPATIVDIARLPIPSDCTTSSTTTTTTASFFPRSGCASAQEAFIDIEYFQYEQHVQAQARAAQLGNNHLGAPGGRHAWKTLVFWKRRRTSRSRAASISGAARLMRPGFLSASSTPLSPRVAGCQTPIISRRHAAHVSRCDSTATLPLYMSDDFDDDSSAVSIRAWYEPMLRRGKLAALQDEEGYRCNRSPYVPLGGRRTPRRLASPGPLYLV